MPNQLVMDHTGHSEHVFDKANVVSVQEANARFDELLRKGFRAATRKPDGNLQLTKSFDPSAEETVFIPHLKGG